MRSQRIPIALERTVGHHSTAAELIIILLTALSMADAKERVAERESEIMRTTPHLIARSDNPPSQVISWGLDIELAQYVLLVSLLNLTHACCRGGS